MRVKEFVLIIIVVLILGAFSILRSCNNAKLPSIVSYEIVTEKQSDELQYKATKLKVNVGATEEYSYKLVITSENEKVNNNSYAVFISYSDFDFCWDADNLIVEFVGTEKIFKQEKSYKNINIIYEPN